MDATNAVLRLPTPLFDPFCLSLFLFRFLSLPFPWRVQSETFFDKEQNLDPSVRRHLHDLDLRILLEELLYGIVAGLTQPNRGVKCRTSSFRAEIYIFLYIITLTFTFKKNNKI